MKKHSFSAAGTDAKPDTSGSTKTGRSWSFMRSTETRNLRRFPGVNLLGRVAGELCGAVVAGELWCRGSPTDGYDTPYFQRLHPL